MGLLAVIISACAVLVTVTLQGCGGSGGATITTTAAPCLKTCQDGSYCSPYRNTCSKPAPAVDVLNMCTKDEGCAATPEFNICDIATQTCVSEGSACNARCTQPAEACSSQEVCSSHVGRCLAMSPQWCNATAPDSTCEDGYSCSELFSRCVRAGATCVAGKEALYIKMIANTDVCSDGSRNVDTEEACHAAASQLSLIFEKTENNADWPRTCYSATDGTNVGVYFNTHGAGQAQSSAQMICEKVELSSREAALLMA